MGMHVWARRYSGTIKTYSNCVNACLFTSGTSGKTSSSWARIYMACLQVPNFATCWAVHEKDDDTHGTVNVLLPTPVGWRKAKGKPSLFPPMGWLKTDLTSCSTSYRSSVLSSQSILILLNKPSFFHGDKIYWGLINHLCSLEVYKQYPCPNIEF